MSGPVCKHCQASLIPVGSVTYLRCMCEVKKSYSTQPAVRKPFNAPISGKAVEYDLTNISFADEAERCADVVSIVGVEDLDDINLPWE